MIFMTKKNCAKLAEFLGKYSLLHDRADEKGRNTIAESLSLEQLLILDSFLKARNDLLVAMSASKAPPAIKSNDSCNGTDNGGNS